MGQVLRQRSGSDRLLADSDDDHEHAVNNSESSKLRPSSSSRSWNSSRRLVVGLLVATAIIALVFLAGSGLRLYNESFEDDDDDKVRQDVRPQSEKEKAVNEPVNLRHAIMIDCGSTGSRLLVFTFRLSPEDNRLVLLDEFFEEVKPGISSFTDTPDKAAASVGGLVDDARQIVPAELRPHTTLSLKATAGLRLLPAEVGENLLNEIRAVFDSSGFLVRSNGVTIIDGKSEGFYLWTTLNFLLGRTSDLNQSVVVADLGGASAQVAMIPLDEVTLREVRPEDISTVSVLGQTIKFYIHSYLGMGLMATRLSVLRSSNRTLDEKSNVFLCPYIHQQANFTWEFQGIKYKIRGVKKAGSHAGPIQELTEQIKRVAMPKVDELKRRTLYAVSYFYDLAVDAGLIEFSQGGSVSVGDYCRSASKACEMTTTVEQPFACVDITYVCVLLRDGFALPEDKIINLKKKIDGHETSWALGAAIVDLHHKQSS